MKKPQKFLARVPVKSIKHCLILFGIFIKFDFMFVKNFYEINAKTLRILLQLQR